MAQYTSVTVSPEAAAELRMFAAHTGALVSRRVTMTDALRLAVRIATAHLADDARPAAEALGIASHAQEGPQQ